MRRAVFIYNNTYFNCFFIFYFIIDLRISKIKFTRKIMYICRVYKKIIRLGSSIIYVYIVLV